VSASQCLSNLGHCPELLATDRGHGDSHTSGPKMRLLITTCLGAVQLSLLGQLVAPTLIYRYQRPNSNARRAEHWRLNHLPGPFRDTDITSNKCRSAPQKFNKLVLVDRNSLPLLSPGTWTRHNVGQALDSCLQWDTMLPGPRGRLPSGHVGGCSDPLVSKPPVLSLVALRRLVAVTTREVPPGPCYWTYSTCDSRCPTYSIAWCCVLWYLGRAGTLPAFPHPLVPGKSQVGAVACRVGPDQTNFHPLLDAYSHGACHSQEAGKQPQIGQMSLAALKKHAPPASSSRQAQWIPFRAGGGAI
jgi:hypothetical protein